MKHNFSKTANQLYDDMEGEMDFGGAIDGVMGNSTGSKKKKKKKTATKKPHT
jgi:hypothetical protein